jgi:hypothetical protein
MTTTMPTTNRYATGKSPVAPLRRLTLLVHGKVGLSAWCYGGLAIGAVLLISGRFLPTEFFDITQYLGVFIFIGSLGRSLFELGSNEMRSREVHAAEDVALIGKGVANPSRHRKQNPELVTAYEDLADELGISLDPLARRSEEQAHLYEAALLVLSGRVAPEDTHLLVTAINRGATDTEEITLIVNEMKANGYALAEGAL